MERTLAVIKPGAVRRNDIAGVLEHIENGMPAADIIAMKMLTFTPVLAAEFYKEHVGKPFYDGLIAHTLSGPCVALVLKGPRVVANWRQAMGPTNPLNDDDPTCVRARFGTELPDNAVHGSDSPEAAAREIGLLFPELVNPDIFGDPATPPVARLGLWTDKSNPTWTLKVDAVSFDKDGREDKVVVRYQDDTHHTTIRAKTLHDLYNYTPEAEPVLWPLGYSPQEPDRFVLTAAKPTTLRFKKLRPDAVIPTKAHPSDAGFDVTSPDGHCLTFVEVIKVPTGLSVEIPEGYELQVRSRSGLTSKGVIVANAPGTIDAGYRGELIVILTCVNVDWSGLNPYFIKPGDRVAQLVFAPVTPCVVEEAAEIDMATGRGGNGFGSTGR